MGYPKMVLNVSGSNNCPCKGCTADTGRHAGCHSSCEGYISWKNEHEQQMSTVRKQREFDEVYYSGAARRNSQLKQKGVSFGRGKNPQDI